MLTVTPRVNPTCILEGVDGVRVPLMSADMLCRLDCRACSPPLTLQPATRLLLV
jgi:hypothetical protein